MASLALSTGTLGGARGALGERGSALTRKVWGGAKNLLLLGAALLLSATCVPRRAQAQSEPQGVPMGPLMCYYGPGQYRPCDEPAPQQTQGPNLLQLSVARYEALLARLRAYGGVRVDERPAPQTLEELTRQVDALYVGTAFRLDTLNFDGRQRARNAQSNEQSLRALEEREAALKVRAEALPAELRAANEKLNGALARAEAYDRLIASVEKLSERMRERADRAAEETVQWLTVATPPEHLHISAALLAGRKRAPHEELVEDKGPALIIAGRPPLPAQLNVTRPPGPRAAPQGTADEKLAAVEGLLPQLSEATEQYAEITERYRKGLAALKEATPRVEILEAAVGGASNSLSEVERLRQRAESREMYGMMMNGPRAGVNAAGAIAEAYILERFRDHVVRPTVLRFLIRNGVTHGIDRKLIVQLYTLHKTLLPNIAGRQWDSLNRLLDAEKRALEVIGDYQTYALEAAALASDPNDRTAAAFAAEIHEGTQAAGEQIIEKAAGEQGPIYTIVKALLGRR
jgi:hypothetical protein